ncbi:MAG: RecX family transcriptional regulator [Deltaproteobacteria bacterium]|nr:RecX family transcriptional regulator [Deltaproteobacteria bacterium]
MPDQARAALDLALKMLARRARSEEAVRRRLAREGFPEVEVESAIARLKELRYLDDRAFAASRASKLLFSGRMGPGSVAQRLASEGLAEEVSEVAIEEARQGASERELALKALEKRRPRVGVDSPLQERVRAARWLVSHGFSEEIARSLLGLGDEPPPE